MTAHRLLLILSLLAQSALFSQSAEPAASRVLTGIVRAEAGEPLRGARVTVSSEFGNGAAEAITNIDGRFEIPVTFGGSYAVNVTRAGSPPARPA